MTPHKMLCDHNPIDQEYGDCLRTVIASMLDMEPINVPHFAHDGADGQTVWARVDEWLAEHKGLSTFRVAFPGEGSLDDVLSTMKSLNPHCYYMLMGRSSDDHIVICLNDQIVHDPSRFGVGLTGPSKVSNLWVVITFIPARLMAHA